MERSHPLQSSSAPALGEVGIVVIGRNEGERLRQCLSSVVGRSYPVVYVDSGSSDGSVELARTFGAEVVELDASAPFTAARARNAGFDHVLRHYSEVRFIQFVDGDCELFEGWLDRAQRELERCPEAAVVCGRLHERLKDRSVYSRLADMEWNIPAGEVASCGGLFLVHSSAFREAGGFNPALIAGEEGDLTHRLRLRGWRILRLADAMAWHDISMTQFHQWWLRSVRTGYTYAESVSLYGGIRHSELSKSLLSVVSWAFALPMTVIVLAWPTQGSSLLLLGSYGILFERARRHRHQRNDRPADARLYAAFCVLGKFPQAIGVLRYWWGRLTARRSGLIEYKMLPLSSRFPTKPLKST
jgi:cellulose synthase/poly-beta-1,6-N-acetylglucosamine synthase-like glycosyltransferase